MYGDARNTVTFLCEWKTKRGKNDIIKEMYFQVADAGK